jgi:hypothetical protein
LRCSPLLESNKAVYFLAADRCGNERKVDFIGIYLFIVGCSCILKLCKKPKVLKNLNKKEENTIYYSINLNEN